ncbi:MAG TPA: glycoside hydrolase family protein, partial [Arenibacter sp.]|nr:glycoside hydrolase family protein [Arenibacter sp.]
MKKNTYPYCFLLVLLTIVNLSAQITERPRPVEWDHLVQGGRFIDLFLPIEPIGPLTKETWGASNVIPRYTDNGIEDAEWSYWGGNALLGDDGKYHLYVCRWREDSAKGHHEWPNSIVVHAIADNSFGPYKVKETIGPGHNPEIFKMQDGRYVLYVINGRYVSESLNGPWEYGKFDFDPRDRPIIEGLSNLSFSRREDGSFIMVCRGGGIWFSENGLSSYNQVTEGSVYPKVEGKFEDPVIWRDNIQYHMIVNDWLGRIAYYLRSKDGVDWKVDPGEAYLPGITKYSDGTEEDWFKYERIKVLQDDLGRATQAHFAVIDVLKDEDRPNDKHSSKNIAIPLTVGRQITLLNRTKIDGRTKSIQVRIMAEKGFDPHSDIDVSSLRFGASEEINFGRGSKVSKVKKNGSDLIITFEGTGNGFTDANFVGKLLGKTSQGNVLFGYARLPWVDFKEPILSTSAPKIEKKGQGYVLRAEVANFGQVPSKGTPIKIHIVEGGQSKEIGSTRLSGLRPFEKTEIEVPILALGEIGKEYEVAITLYPKD